MSQTRPQDLEGGDDTGPGMSLNAHHFDLFPLISQTCIVDDHSDRPQSRSDRPWQPAEGESEYRDNSWPLYSMYSKITEEEDDKMIERCHKDADGILIFVRLHFCPRMTPQIN